MEGWRGPGWDLGKAREGGDEWKDEGKEGGKRGRTSTNLAMSEGKHSPVGEPEGPTVDSQLYSRRKSVPDRVVEIRPRMKKQVLWSGRRVEASVRWFEWDEERARGQDGPSDGQDGRLFCHLDDRPEDVFLLEEREPASSRTNVTLCRKWPDVS